MKKDKNDLIESFKKKLKIYKKYNKLYHLEDKPAITDEEFDNLKKELIQQTKSVKSNEVIPKV